jgi:hypothetical protein
MPRILPTTHGVPVADRLLHKGGGYSQMQAKRGKFPKKGVDWNEFPWHPFVIGKRDRRRATELEPKQKNGRFIQAISDARTKRSGAQASRHPPRWPA